MCANNASYINEMNELLRRKIESGTQGIRLFVSDRAEVSRERVAREFCRMERSRSQSGVRFSVGF